MLPGASDNEDDGMLPNVPTALLGDAEDSDPLGPEMRITKDTQGNPCIQFDLGELQNCWKERALQNNQVQITSPGSPATKFAHASLQVSSSGNVLEPL